MPTVTTYSRVSDNKLTDTGERRQDVMRQVDRLKPYIEAWLNNNSEWKQLEPFIDDGKSAFKEDYQSRPAFCKLLNEIKAHRIQRVYVESLDRWSRRVVEGLTTLEETSNCGCTVVSIAEGEVSWTQPQGWFRSLIALGMAEWASREKSWRVKQAMQRRRDDKRKTCKACGVVHLGRHPDSCNCLKCRGKKGRSKN